MPLERSRIILNSESRNRMGSAVPHLRSVKVRWLTKKTSERNGVSPKSGVVIARGQEGDVLGGQGVAPGPKTS